MNGLQPRPKIVQMVKTVTGKGEVHLEGPVSAAVLEPLRLNEGMNCFRPPLKQLQALISLSRQPDGLVFLSRHGHTIVSYLTFQKSDFPWWRKRWFPQLLELGALETDPEWRKKGVTSALLAAIFCNPAYAYFEDFIVFSIQSAYYWDIDRTGLSPWPPIK